MNVYCISYDLKGDDYEPLIENIKSYGIWWHQSRSTWFIQSEKGADEICLDLKKNIQSGDKMIVIKVQNHWWATGHTEKEYKWLKSRFGDE
jgi:hypothetical protein